MSTYPTTSTQGVQTAGAPSKPGTLTAAVVVAVLAGLAAVVNGVMMLAGGAALAKDLVVQGVADLTGMSVEEVRAVAQNAVLDTELKKVQDTMQVRAYILVIFGGALLLFGILMRKAALWARILVTISAVLAMGGSVIVAADVSTSLMAGLGWAAVLAALVAIVVTWLPANGRYAKALKKA